MYDAIVVGTRVAGAPTAMLLARRGLRCWRWTARGSPATRSRPIRCRCRGSPGSHAGGCSSGSGRPARRRRASAYEAIADLCGVPVGTVRSRLNAARTQLADALLETAAERHPGPARELAVATGVAMTAFRHGGDETVLHDVLRPDLSFRLFDGVERHGRAHYAAAMARDFEDGVSARVRNVVIGADLPVVELWLDNPPDQPLHCPPATTQVHFHDGRSTRRIVAHYATPP
jgi:RNA polymerase sigma-70 factor (ECF subfamily)